MEQGPQPHEIDAPKLLKSAGVCKTSYSGESGQKNSRSRQTTCALAQRANELGESNAGAQTLAGKTSQTLAHSKG